MTERRRTIASKKRFLNRTASLDGFCGLNRNKEESVDWMSLAREAREETFQKGEQLITGRSDSQKHKKNTNFIKEGEKLDHPFILLNGEVSLENSAGVQAKKIIDKPQFYGESWFLNRPATITVTVHSSECSAIILPLDIELEELFTEDEYFSRSGNSAPTSNVRGPLKNSKSPPTGIPIQRVKSGMREDINEFMAQLSVTRVPSDPNTKKYRLAQQRMELFRNIAAKLIYRLQDSLESYKAEESPSHAPHSANSSSSGRYLTVKSSTEPPKGHKRFVIKIK